MTSYKVEQVFESVMNFTGKNMFFCRDTNMLYWCDILGGTVFRMDFNNNNNMHMFRILGEKMISFCFPIQGKKDQFIVGTGRRILLVNWDGVNTMGQIVKVLGEIQVNGVRINQCKVDKMGRLFFGTMINEEQGDIFDNKRIGGLYRFTMNEGIVQVKDNVGFGNGITWNNNFTKMYFVDSFDLNVYEFDYDMKTGNVHNQKVFMDITSFGQVKKVFATGITTDHDDNIWVCMFGNGKVIKINTKTHKVDTEVKFNNVHQLTGCEFVGKNLDVMYVTTCCIGHMGQQQTYPSGFLMRVNNLGVRGVDMHKFIVN